MELCHYTEEGGVLLALTKEHSEPKRYAQCIFALCHIDPIILRSSDYMNPEIGPKNMEDWPICIPIKRMWRLNYRRYDLMEQGELRKLASVDKNRGQLLRVPRASERELQNWLPGALGSEVPVYRRVPKLIDERVDA